MNCGITKDNDKDCDLNESMELDGMSVCSGVSNLSDVSFTDTELSQQQGLGGMSIPSKEDFFTIHYGHYGQGLHMNSFQI